MISWRAMTLEQKLYRALQSIPAVFTGEGFWYFLLAAAAWLGLYVLFARWMRRRRIADHDPTWKQMWWELAYSLRSLFVFGIVGGFMAFSVMSGWTQMYFKFDRFGQVYFWLSIPLMIVMHDTYFYWTHRLMHHPRLFRLFHRVHHLSTSPTPWAAYSFSVPEAFVQAGIGPLIIFLIPNHPAAFSVFMIWQISFNVLGHCGHELMPQWFMRSGCGYLLNTATHHAMHHESNRVNFGLYFNWWDRLLGTNHRHYAERFRAVTQGSQAVNT
jgi:lathosterol oxidase